MLFRAVAQRVPVELENTRLEASHSTRTPATPTYRGVSCHPLLPMIVLWWSFRDRPLNNGTPQSKGRHEPKGLSIRQHTPAQHYRWKRSTPPTDASPISSTDEDAEAEAHSMAKSKAAELAEALSADAEAEEPATSQRSLRSATVQNGSVRAICSPKRSQDDLKDASPSLSIDDSLFASSQPAKRRKIRGYGGQRNTGFKFVPDVPETKKALEEEEPSGFRLPGDRLRASQHSEHGEPIVAEQGFQVPPEMSMPSPMAKRTTESSNKSKRNKVSAGFKIPKISDEDPFDISTFKVPDKAVILENLKDEKKKLDEIFKTPLEVPGNVSSSSISTNAEQVFDHDLLRSRSSSPLLSIASNVSSVLSEDLKKSSKAGNGPLQVAQCPMCHEKVDRDFLEDFDNGRRLRVKRQQAFCQAHKLRSAREQWRERGYPIIVWASFDERLKKYFDQLEKLLRSEEPSFYRNMLAESVKGGERYFKKDYFEKNQDVLTAGYYGSHGARQM